MADGYVTAGPPPVGSTVALRWSGAYVEAVVVEHKRGLMLDLDYNGITVLSVGYGPTGWMHQAPDASGATRRPCVVSGCDLPEESGSSYCTLHGVKWGRGGTAPSDASTP